MKDQLLFSSDESTTDHPDDYSNSSRSIATNDNDSDNNNYYWWRWAAEFDHVKKMQMKLDHERLIFPGGGRASSHFTAAARMRVVRELERLALVSTHQEGVNELRHKLLMYRSGDFWIPTGGLAKENMDIPPVATILLVGFSASGKSSLVNLMYSVLGRSGLVPFAQTSPPPGSFSNNPKSTSMILKEHNVLRSLRSGFCVYDSRGFDYNRIGEGLEELSSWMSDGIHHNQVCLRPGDDVEESVLMNLPDMDVISKFARRKVNCAMVVANMAEIYKAFQAGDSKPMDATKQLFCSVNNAFTNIYNDESTILILTHGDMLTTEERIEGRLKICECLGVSETSGVYDIVTCLSEYGFLAEESDPVSAYALSEAVYMALLLSDRTHSPKKTLGDWAVLILSSIMCFLASIFGLLAQICLKLGRHSKDV
ncbi:unnamed protein product [Malus baccata var. baccata]